MPDLHLSILPPMQRAVWDVLSSHAAGLRDGGYYLAGGTALALQLGHRQSVDFEFFSQTPSLVEKTQAWLERLPGFTVRDIERDTLHGDVAGVKLSFIGGYKYPLVAPVIDAGTIPMAGPLDIGLMKLLAITHRATPRDYVDLAALVNHRYSLSRLLGASTRKLGPTFNPMVSVRALTAFDDLEGEMPMVLDQVLARSWKEVLQEEVRRLAA